MPAASLATLGKGLPRAALVRTSLPTRRAAVTPRHPPRKTARPGSDNAPRARLFLDEHSNFSKSEFADKMDSTRFINWVQHSFG